jgi:hypothetical protein
MKSCSICKKQIIDIYYEDIYHDDKLFLLCDSCVVKLNYKNALNVRHIVRVSITTGFVKHVNINVLRRVNYVRKLRGFFLLVYVLGVRKRLLTV